MAVGEGRLPDLVPISGVRVAAAEAAVRKPGRPDVVLFEVAPGSRCAVVFTTNRFRAAPVTVAEEHLATTASPRYLLVNTGNANAGTGADGIARARACCEAVARAGNCEASAVLPFSTGVIGETLADERITAAVPSLFEGLEPDGWAEAASGILTTDTRPKGASVEVSIGGRPCRLTGIAKGAGMIRPDMATMLAFIATDADVPGDLLRRALRDAVATSFNRITVDGDTSTNDACALIATGQGEARVDVADATYVAFTDALRRLCTELAHAVVRDGEGATRFVTVRVTGARTSGEAERVAFTLAESPLVKTALFAGDPNWGRLLAATGRAGIDDLDVEGVCIALGDYPIAERGARAPNYEESEAARRMAGDEVEIHVDLGRGEAEDTVWTCDLSYEYVRINADYRS